MKVLALVLALVAVAVCQNCDIDRSWSQYQTASRYAGGLWEEKELIGWGMDGDNKWNDFWSFRTTASSSRTHYDRVTCGFRSGSREIPNYVAFCGDCSLTAGANTCGCYPYHDVADNFLPYPGPESGEAPVAPEGWPSAWVAGNPPFEQFPASDGVGAWTLENCQQYKPQYVYYYTYKLKISGNGEFQKSWGISKGFEPSQDSWNDFCEDVFTNENNCYVPSTAGGSNDDDDERLNGAEYQYQMGEWRENDSNDIQFYHYHFENGCHMKARNRKYPSAVYCGDAAGWTFGAGTTAHVRFGCDVGTFFDTETDSGRDIDDSDCESVYVAFDAVNPLELTKDEYDTGMTSRFAPVASLVRGDDGTDCWYESSFTDHRQGLPDYRTKCSAGVLAVPFVALISTIVMVLRNLF